MFGYIQDFSITNDHIKVLFFDEGMIRIYYQVVPKNILYIDCSGYLALQINNISRVFNYCIAIRHPISKVPALPVFECKASTHSTESVQSMLVHFKSKETAGSIPRNSRNRRNPRRIIITFLHWWNSLRIISQLTLIPFHGFFQSKITPILFSANSAFLAIPKNENAEFAESFSMDRNW